MTKIYTKGGDKGETGLFSGERVSKNHPLVNAYGTVDELNSVIGVARSQIAFDDDDMLDVESGWVDEMLEDLNVQKIEGTISREEHAELSDQVMDMLPDSIGGERLDDMLNTIQLELFEVGATMAFGKPGEPRINDKQVERFERWIDELTAGLPPLSNFILPTGHPVAAQLHYARTVCRRAERLAVAVYPEGHFDAVVIRYLNRLADLLFVLAREANRIYRAQDIVWHSPRS